MSVSVRTFKEGFARWENDTLTLDCDWEGGCEWHTADTVQAPHRPDDVLALRRRARRVFDWETSRLPGLGETDLCRLHAEEAAKSRGGSDANP